MIPIQKLLGKKSREWRHESIPGHHSWTDGEETIELYYTTGSGKNAGYVVEVQSEGHDITMCLSNGFVGGFRDALILADLYMRDDAQYPAAFMHSDRVESDFGLGDTVRQDEWLAAHSSDYEFAVVDRDKFEIAGSG